MSDSREGSPDWLREFQAPERDVMSLSSASDSSPERPSQTSKDEIERGKDKAEPISIDSGDEVPKIQTKKKKSTKIETTLVAIEDDLDTQEGGLVEGDVIKEKTEGSSVSQRLPLVFPEKVQRTKALVECDGDSIDLSGDVGAVGRLVISDGPNGRDDLLLDLKGTLYKSTIVPSRTFCIVSVGQTEAKIEAIMNDFIQLEPQSNLFEAETMVEGTLEGFLFDSDEEADKATEANRKEKNNGNGDQPTSKNAKRKSDKSSAGGVQKKAKKAAAKPAKRAPRKTQSAKRTKKASK
ncbi:double-stranded DNA binding protein [Rhynchospora pubera]|uniref:Double-stranded DNA binding protein n=1 Tax=Rhynchospora pubera TaxID=906938 RepID=A0AAV8HIM4_9POAL|nr:double-stranded DNA binding protein [Rhynchospora pubera]